MDVLGYDLVTDPTNKLPQLAPDGNYCPSTSSVSEESDDLFLIYPNPSSTYVTITGKFDVNRNIYVSNSLGTVVDVWRTIGNQTHFDVNHLSSGIYFLKINGTTRKLLVMDLIVDMNVTLNGL